MADRVDAKFAQILGRQPAQDLPVDVVLAKRGRVLLEPEAAQPFGHVHRNCIKNREPCRIIQPACGRMSRRS